ncbi:MAG: hypothetical protein MI919_37230 [Holophagales bacterium]|nr:hypothetical protein [Holophagales bacterium]
MSPIRDIRPRENRPTCLACALDRPAAVVAVLATFLVAALALAVPAAAGDREVIRDRLQLVYVASSTASGEVLDNAAIHGGTESGNFWSNSQLDDLQRLVRQLLRDEAGGGDTSLQYYTRKILDINNDSRLVQLRMFDDVTQTLNRTTTRRRHGGCVQSNGRAWPCASFLGTRTHVGAMWIGEFNLARTGLDTFLHELVHTQDRTDGRAHYFTVGNRNYRYGADQVHYNTELVPNRAMTYTEGIANAVRLMYAPQKEQKYWQIFRDNGFLFVEKAAPAQTSGVSPDIWLYNQLQAANVPETPLPADLARQLRREIREDYAHYRFRDLPPRFLAHNEYVIAMVIAKYVEHVSENRFFEAIEDANAVLFQASGSGFAVLMESLCAAGLPEGESASSILEAAESVEGRNQAYLLPIAFMDYLTNFAVSSEQELAELFENLMPEEWIQLYWIEGRSLARSAVRPPSEERPRRDALTDIAIALGVTSQSE